MQNRNISAEVLSAMVKFRTGFIGCGLMAREHMKALASLPDVKFEAFSDIVFERAVQCSEVHGGTAYQSYSEMLNREALDTVYIVVPPFAHSDQELLCVEKEIPFFIEKPVASTLKKAKEVYEAVERKNLTTQVGYLSRFNDALGRMRELFRKEPSQTVFFETSRYGSIAYGPDHWWRRKECSGGELVERATHQVDLARWFIDDEAETVYAQLDYSLLKDEPNFSVEDFSTVIVKFRGGSIATITSTCAAKKASTRFVAISKEVHLEASGDKYSAYMNGENLEFKAMVNPVLEENRHFLECVARGVETTVPYKEGLKTLEITLAAVKSAETGKVVKLPL